MVARGGACHCTFGSQTSSRTSRNAKTFGINVSFTAPKRLFLFHTDSRSPTPTTFFDPYEPTLAKSCARAPRKRMTCMSGYGHQLLSHHEPTSVIFTQSEFGSGHQSMMFRHQPFFLRVRQWTPVPISTGRPSHTELRSVLLVRSSEPILRRDILRHVPP